MIVEFEKDGDWIHKSIKKQNTRQDDLMHVDTDLPSYKKTLFEQEDYTVGSNDLGVPKDTIS